MRQAEWVYHPETRCVTTQDGKRIIADAVNVFWGEAQTHAHGKLIARAPEMEKRIEVLEVINAKLLKALKVVDGINELIAKAPDMERRIEELEQALEEAAEQLDYIMSVPLIQGDLDRAKATLFKARAALKKAKDHAE